MTRIIAIVEGDGEVRALPILLRRIAEWRSPATWIEVPTPIRVRRDRFLARDDEFRRYVRMAELQAKPDGSVIILLDADDDCPVELAASIQARAADAAPAARVAVVLANREFEAWLIAAAESLVGKRGFTLPGPPPTIQTCDVMRKGGSDKACPDAPGAQLPTSRP